MVLCNPTKNYWGLNYKPLEDYKNDNFVLQHNSWFGSYRILIHCPVLKNSYLIAWATKRKEIIDDWDLLQTELNTELIRAGQNLNEQSLLTFIQHLVTASSPQDPPSSPTNSASSINSPATTSPEPQKLSILHAAKTNKINNKSQLSQFLKDGDISLQETDECGRTLLHFLSRISSSDKEHLELIKFAIQRGACIESKDSDNWTPLHCACYAGNLSLIELYIKSGAPLFSTTRDGTLPFVYLVRKMYDSESEKTRQFKLFLEMVNMGVSVNTQNLRGETPLHGAVISQNVHTLKWLLEQNADPNIANKNNELPLHYVARFGNLEMAKLLIEKGSDPVAKSMSGTPLDVATFHNRLDIAEYLVGVIETTQTSLYDALSSPPTPPPLPPTSEPKTVPMSPKTMTRNRYKTVEVMQQLGMQSPDEHSNASPPISESILLSPKKNAVVPHSFHIRQFSRPTWCEYCNGFIFGMLRQGYTCESCGYTVHNTCRKSALFWEECKKKEEETSTMEVAEPSVDTPEMMARSSSSSSRRSSISSSSGKEQSLTSSVLLQPYLAYFDAKELDVIYHQFQSMDIDQDGYIKEQEFIDSIGIMCDLPFAQAMYSLIDENRDNKIDFIEFLTAMTILFKGSPHEQLAFSFGLFSPDEMYITRENFSRVIESFAKTFEQVKVDDFVQNTFDKADVNKRGKITTEEWISMAMNNYVYVQSLGLLHKDNSCENSQRCSTSHLSKNSLLVQYIHAEMAGSSGKRKGIPISFGHHSWDICYHMMLGMRHAIQDVLKSEEKALEAKDYELHVDKSLSSNKQEEWVFRDYAGHVFHHIRKLAKIGTAGYMFSLGPEKILGNLLLGNFDSLCELASTGRSGSFFFKSTDNKYLIKTLPLEELIILQKILPAYLEYLETNPNSFLTRVFGLHSLKKASAKEIQFTVMENLFDSPLPVQEQYDLKGSTVGRHVEVDEPDPEIALKDNDFKRRINLGTKMKAQMLEQIENDTRFLEKQGICDYSFLVGYHFLSDSDREYIQKLEKIFPKDARDSVFRQYFGGILSEDKTEVYFMGIIDLLTTYNYKKMGEYFAKSFLHDSTQISAIRPTPYRNRFLKYMSTIVD